MKDNTVTVALLSLSKKCSPCIIEAPWCVVAYRWLYPTITAKLEAFA